MQSNIPDLCLVIPCYNPEENWASELIKAFQELKLILNNAKIHLIIVNDGSSRNFTEGFRKLKLEIEEITLINSLINKGKGDALRKGFSVSNSPVIIFTDVDIPFEVRHIAMIYRLIISGKYDVVIGERGKEYYQTCSFLRNILSKALRFIVRILFNEKISDSQCGIKGFNSTARKIFLTTKIKGYLFDLEFLHSAVAANLKINSLSVKPRKQIFLTSLRSSTVLQELINLVIILSSKQLKYFMRSLS
ncbi:MAG: glycosyltransferase [Cytophagaceae bacterium]